LVATTVALVRQCAWWNFDDERKMATTITTAATGRRGGGLSGCGHTLAAVYGQLPINGI
ncbi:unnamed protein product, partial [Ectocarpus sp. 6 AP-2014]